MKKQQQHFSRLQVSYREARGYTKLSVGVGRACQFWEAVWLHLKITHTAWTKSAVQLNGKQSQTKKVKKAKIFFTEAGGFQLSSVVTWSG